MAGDVPCRSVRGFCSRWHPVSGAREWAARRNTSRSCLVSSSRNRSGYGVAALQAYRACPRPHHQDHRRQPQQSLRGCDMCFALSTPLLFKACLYHEFKRMQILRLLCVVLKIRIRVNISNLTHALRDCTEIWWLQLELLVRDLVIGKKVNHSVHLFHIHK